MKVYARSDVGLLRPNNEDTFLVKERDNVHIFLVCDGMGGHKKGEVASQMARDFVNNYNFILNGRTDEEILEDLKNMVNKANINIYLKGKNDECMSGMGTTFSLAIYFEDKIYFAHVGDSRIYVLTDSLSMISKDHTLISELAEQGIIIDMNEKKELKNYITQALGSSSIIEPTIGYYDARNVKKIFICSDGVTSYFEDKDIENMVKEDKSPQEIVDKIVESALKCGGKDNITCLVAEIGE